MLRTRSLNSPDDSFRRILIDQRTASSGTATLGSAREIMLTIDSYTEYVQMGEGSEVELGRYESPEPNQVNLTPYGAIEYGLSRRHAKLYLMKGRLYIADLNSTNGTYVRGQKLQPAEPTPVRNGDEVLLGRMRVKVEFDYQ